MKAKIMTKDGVKIMDINRRKAIRLKCLDCSGFSEKEVKECPVSDCELYSFRMGVGRQDPKERNQAIKRYCREFCMLGSKDEVSKCVSQTCSLFNFRSYSKKLTHIQGSIKTEI